MTWKELMAVLMLVILCSVLIGWSQSRKGLTFYKVLIGALIGLSALAGLVIKLFV